MFAVLRDMDRVTTDVDMYYRQITFHFRASDEAKVKALIADLPATLSQTFTDEDTREKFESAVKKTGDYTVHGDTLVYVAPENYEEAVNMRLAKFGIQFVDHPLRPKYAKLIANMQAELDAKGKQLVFTEEKSQHGKLARIIVNNLPVTADQIAITCLWRLPWIFPVSSNRWAEPMQRNIRTLNSAWLNGSQRAIMSTMAREWRQSAKRRRQNAPACKNYSASLRLKRSAPRTKP